MACFPIDNSLTPSAICPVDTNYITLFLDDTTQALYKRMLWTDFAACVQSEGVQPFDATVSFSANTDPNSGGTIFSPNTPGLTTVVYVSTIDGSQWTYDAGTYTLYIAPYWSKVGNSGTIPGVHFIGTTDDQPLVFKTNNIQTGYLDVGMYNVSFGVNALPLTTSGDLNTAIGVNALSVNTTGRCNTAIGADALMLNTSGEYNLAFGGDAMHSNVNGVRNTAVGQGVLYDAPSSSYNVGIGWAALNHTTGSYNTAVGTFSLGTAGTGQYNVAHGYESGFSNTNGIQNVFLGYKAGYFNTTASNQIFINSLNRTNYLGDQTQSPIYIQQNATIASQNIFLNGEIYHPYLTNLTTQDRLVGVLNSSGRLGNITIGSGLSLVSGVLSNTNSTTGTVTSVASGNGMNFSTITSTGTVTLGTPSSTTLVSTNATTTNSHTHAFAPGGTSSQVVLGDATLASFSDVVTGGQVVVFDWKFSTSVGINNPGSGSFRADSVIPGAIIALSIADITSTTGMDISTLFGQVAGNWLIHIQQSNDASKFIQFSTSTTYTDHTTWWEVPVTFVQSSGFPFANNTKCTFIFVNENSGSGFTPAALTKTDDTNVTLTLGGTPATALLQPTSLTLGWTGTLADGRISSASTWNAKQDALVSGTNIKTVNGSSLLGSGNLVTPAGTVTNFSAGDLAPLFTTTEATTTTTPALSFALTDAAGGTLFGNSTGAPLSPAYTAQPILGSNLSGTGTLGFKGSLSGVVTIQPQNGAGTYNFNLPTTAGTSGYLLTSAGGGSSAMTWTDPASLGGGTVNSVTGTTNRITSTGGSTPVIDISASYIGQTSLTTLGTISTGIWQGVLIDSTYGGTGVNNAGRTLTVNTNSGTINFTAGSKTLTVPLDATVSGTNTGDQTTITGNAGTATALATPRTIGGVSFNGTANIVPQTIQTINEATDTTCFPLFVTTAGTQSLQPLNNAGFIYNSNTNALTATTFIGALTGTASGNLVSGGALGTPSSGTLTNCTFPTLNQNTSGSAGSVLNALTIGAELISGGASSYNGSAAKTLGIQATSVTNGMLAGSIASSKLVGTDIATVGTITSGTWNGTLINQAYLGTGGGGAAKFLREDNTWQAVAGSGDMILASVQSVTGLKTFDKDKLATKGTSTGVVTISNALTTSTSRTFTLPDADVTAAQLTKLTTSTASNTASTIVERDANSNINYNNIVGRYITTATAAGTTTLTVSSTYDQYFTGATTQTLVLPDATTLFAGMAYRIVNNSTGIVTVNKNGGTLIVTMDPSTELSVQVTDISTAAGTWSTSYSGGVLVGGSKALGSNFTTSSVTAVSTNLAFAVLANEVYDVVVEGSASKATSATGLKLAIDAPSGATIVGEAHLGGATLAASLVPSLITAISTLGTTFATGTAIQVAFRLTFRIKISSTAGNVTLQGATVTSNVATIYAGTRMTWTKATEV